MVEKFVHVTRQPEGSAVDRDRCTHAGFVELNPPEHQEAIRQQLDRLLVHPLFSHSKRYPAFLNFIVEKVLCGCFEDLKERIIGVEVFQRSTGYDTNESPIVRVTAGELRKRLELYYYEAGHEDELRIELPIGCYVPLFFLPDATHTHAAVGLDAGTSDTQFAAAPQIARKIFSFRLPNSLQWVSYPILWLAVASVVILSTAFFYRATRADSVVDQFWGDIVASRDPVALCLARGTGSTTVPSSMGVVMPDIETMNSIRDTLQSHKREFRLVNATSGDLSDLNHGPVVFVGPFYTPWVKQMVDPLRFHILHETGSGVSRIEDSQNPSSNRWVEVGSSAPGPPKTESHAIVARFVNRSTGQPIVIATGLSPFGTVAAGEVLTDPQFMNALLISAPRDWQRMNLEAVITTQISDGKAGPPQIDAVYFWE